VTTLLVNTGRGRYAPITLLPMLFVITTTMTASAQMVPQFVKLVQLGQWSLLKGALNIGLTVFVIACVLMLLLIAAGRWLAVLRAPKGKVLPEEGAA
jgi:carbon starvation protein